MHHSAHKASNCVGVSAVTSGLKLLITYITRDWQIKLQSPTETN
jgi:hypothetical protein